MRTCLIILIAILVLFVWTQAGPPPLREEVDSLAMMASDTIHYSVGPWSTPQGGYAIRIKHPKEILSGNDFYIYVEVCLQSADTVGSARDDNTDSYQPSTGLLQIKDQEGKMVESCCGVMLREKKIREHSTENIAFGKAGLVLGYSYNSCLPVLRNEIDGSFSGLLRDPTVVREVRFRLQYKKDGSEDCEDIYSEAFQLRISPRFVDSVRTVIIVPSRLSFSEDCHSVTIAYDTIDVNLIRQNHAMMVTRLGGITGGGFPKDTADFASRILPELRGTLWRSVPKLGKTDTMAIFEIVEGPDPTYRRLLSYGPCSRTPFRYVLEYTWTEEQFELRGRCKDSSR